MFTKLPQQEHDDALNLLSAILNNHQAEAAILSVGDFN